MDGVQAAILKVKKRIDAETLEEDKILKYLRALDEIPIGFDILKSTGIGKSVNNLKKHGGNVAVLSKVLVKKWKNLVPGITPSPKKSPLNTVESEVIPEQQTQSRKSVDYGVKSSKLSDHDKPSGSPVMEKVDNKKRKAPGMQLCDISFVSSEPTPSKKKVKKTSQKKDIFMSNTLSKSTGSLPTSEEIGASLLPDIQPNYVPQRHPDFPDSSFSPKTNKVSTSADITADLLSSRKSKTQVFSGRRSVNKCGVVISLYDMCIRVLVENIEALYDTGGVPYEILEPVLAKCNPAQLWNLEDYNPYFIEDTGPLWKNHCHKDFKGTVPEDHDDWRALYLKKHEERERRLKSINEKIHASQAAKTPVRQVKMAYIQTQAKAPPQVRRKQIKHGTGQGLVIAPPTRVRAPASIQVGYSSRPVGDRPRPIAISPRKSKTTPLMKKVKQMGNVHRSRARSEIIRR